jgi:ABC transport system ATP-binding/permease protein
MNESILRALMRLFAIIANVNKDGISRKARTIVKTYLEQHLSTKLVNQYLSLFDEYLKMHHRQQDETVKNRKLSSANSVKVLTICNHIKEALQQKEKFIVLVRLLEFIHEDEKATTKELSFVETVADIFKISNNEFQTCMKFIFAQEVLKSGIDDLLVIAGKEAGLDGEYEDFGTWFQTNLPSTEKHYKLLFNEFLRGRIVFIHIESINLFLFKYIGSDTIYLNGHNIIPGRAYVFETGSLIKGSKISPVYYNDIASQFIQDAVKSKIVYVARDIQYHFKGSKNGIQHFNFCEESGQLIGIMGGSGVGKSTLLNLLNGTLEPNTGRIYINGYNLHKDKDKLEGVIGFVPQDDLLVEELTVFQNLYYNGKLCFGNYSEERLLRVVTKLLIDLDLYEIKELTVGSPLNKFISGGQRKRLNIALELIREPSILIVDEPTSGLSSMDSEIVMALLKEQTLKGKLVIVNIHQPSSDVFKLFDKLVLLDKGGFPVYYGNPIDAVVYFKTAYHHVNANESECPTCGNVNPEQILQIIETKELNEYGKFTHTRKVSPREWFNLYLENIESKIPFPEDYKKYERLPKNYFKIPNRFKQFQIFSIRNLLSKFSNKQYVLINFLETPILAMILGYFTKFIVGTDSNPDEYIFSENINIFAYLFMCVIVSLFIGMTVSAEEIIKDRKLLQRESFLNLSRTSYLNSKVVFLFALSAIQTILFLLVGNQILQIKGMTMSYWFIMFSSSCFANMLGLNISSGLNSVVTIYILIPFMLVPQLLLSGVIVNFNKLHKNVTNLEVVPVVGDMMVSRWAYEALAVEQYKNNKYQRNFYTYDQAIQSANFRSVYLLPNLQSRVDFISGKLNDAASKSVVDKHLIVLTNEISQLSKEVGGIPVYFLDSLKPLLVNVNVLSNARKFLTQADQYFIRVQNGVTAKKDAQYLRMVKKTSEAEMFKLKQKYHNKRLSEIVENRAELDKIVEYEGRLIQMKDPIYKIPQNSFGRAHFYAPIKKIGNYYIDTFWFNIGVIWCFIFFLFVTLRQDFLRKIITYFENLRFKRQAAKDILQGNPFNL